MLLPGNLHCFITTGVLAGRTSWDWLMTSFLGSRPVTGWQRVSFLSQCSQRVSQRSFGDPREPLTCPRMRKSEVQRQASHLNLDYKCRKWPSGQKRGSGWLCLVGRSRLGKLRELNIKEGLVSSFCFFLLTTLPVWDQSWLTALNTFSLEKVSQKEYVMYELTKCSSLT